MASEILGKTVLASYGLSDDVQPEESGDGVDTERAESASEDSLDAETEVTEPEANSEEEEPETLEEDNETDGKKGRKAKRTGLSSDEDLLGRLAWFKTCTKHKATPTGSERFKISTLILANHAFGIFGLLIMNLSKPNIGLG